MLFISQFFKRSKNHLKKWPQIKTRMTKPARAHAITFMFRQVTKVLVMWVFMNVIALSKKYTCIRKVSMVLLRRVSETPISNLLISSSHCDLDFVWPWTKVKVISTSCSSRSCYILRLIQKGTQRKKSVSGSNIHNNLPKPAVSASKRIMHWKTTWRPSKELFSFQFEILKYVFYLPELNCNVPCPCLSRNPANVVYNLWWVERRGVYQNF